MPALLSLIELMMTVEPLRRGDSSSSGRNRLRLRTREVLRPPLLATEGTVTPRGADTHRTIRSDMVSVH